MKPRVIALAVCLVAVGASQTISGLTESPSPSKPQPKDGTGTEWRQEPNSFVCLKFDATESDYKGNPSFKGFSRFNDQKPCVNFGPLVLTCPRFLYQTKLEFPWVDHTPFVGLCTLPPSPSSQML